ncbi:MAG: hypothetical protein CL869_01810 [Cytophagia bacterium]|nr:hypothetical protein [Cytophagia bacterium]
MISKNFENIFIDFDGVILDSNKFKEEAIENVIFDLFGKYDYNRKAIKYFNEFAGIGRKKKLLKFFNEDEVVNILNLYNSKCKNYLTHAKPTIGFKDFLIYFKNEFKNTNLYILSGSESNEIEYFLRKNFILNYFRGILASEKSKLNHLLSMTLKSDDIFIGDSKSDLKAAMFVNMQFILMEGFRSDNSYPAENNSYKNIYKTENFFTLLNYLKL